MKQVVSKSKSNTSNMCASACVCVCMKIGPMREFRVFLCIHTTHIYWILNDIRIGWINFFSLRFRSLRTLRFILLLLLPPLYVRLDVCFFLLTLCTCMVAFTNDKCCPAAMLEKKRTTKQNYQYSKMCSMNISTIISHFIWWNMIWNAREQSKNPLSIFFVFGFLLLITIGQPKWIDLIDFLCLTMTKCSHMLHLKCFDWLGLYIYLAHRLIPTRWSPNDKRLSFVCNSSSFGWLPLLLLLFS